MISPSLPAVFDSGAPPTYVLRQSISGPSASQVTAFLLDSDNQKRIHPLIVSIRSLDSEGPGNPPPAAPERGEPAEPSGTGMGRDMSTSLYEITDESTWFGCVKHKLKYQARVSTVMHVTRDTGGAGLHA